MFVATPSHTHVVLLLCSKSAATARGFKPLRAEPNVFRVHPLSRSDTCFGEKALAGKLLLAWKLLHLQDNNIECTKNLIHFPICACHPCAGAMLIFSVSFQFYRMFPEGNPRSPLPPICFLPHSSHPTNAGCLQVGANSFFKSTRSRIAARHMRPPGGEPGAQAWEACMLPLFYRPHDTSQETRQWLLRIAPLPFLSFSPQATQRCRQTSDSEGIRTPAGRAQWISGPSPWPFGQHCHACSCLPQCICISRESNPGHIDGNDVFCH